MQEALTQNITTSNQNFNGHFRFIKSYYILERHDEVTLFTFNKQSSLIIKKLIAAG